MKTAIHRGIDLILTWLDSTIDAKIMIAMESPLMKTSVYTCADHVIRDLGREYVAKECPAELMGEPQQCYYNCLELCSTDPERWTYVEGYALSPHSVFPHMHAWVIDNDDPEKRIIDPTWPWASESVYFGVAMPFDVVAAAALRNNSTGVFEADWVNDFYFVREGWVDCVPS